VNEDWTRWLSPVRTAIDCEGAVHHLVWRDGRLHADDHDDELGERTLAALGGQQHACLEVTDAWMRHADDLRVLMLASRGPADPVRVPEMLRPGGGPLGMTGFGAGPGFGISKARSGPRLTRSSTIRISSVRTGSVPPAPPLPDDPADDAGLLLLLGLSGGLAHRLCATVASHWSALVDAGGAGDHRAALLAALHGRVRAATRSWLDEPNLGLLVELIDAGQPPNVDRHRDELHVLVPFRWLIDVWAPGLAVVAGHLVLAADHVDDRLELDAVTPDLAPKRLTLDGVNGPT
jgi:hypothetical protein